MATSITLQMRDHPELRPLVLHDVTPTGNTIGAGSYGSVEEVAIPGALCAAKKIHHILAKEDVHWVPKEVVDENIRKFVAECRIMGRLRHPNIVQFLGLWFSQAEESCLPAIVMEKMLMSLHDLLAPKSSTVPKQYIPLGLKCSILQDIARGIAYLHKQKPPVIHRDLTAANVLLNSSMVAKIADLGMARILPDKRNATMTKAPGTMIYMPPEAMEDRSKYNTSIDLFSLGVVAIFVLAQEFPCDLRAATYTSDVMGLVARTELERRQKYTAKLYSVFPKPHPLIKLIESCLENTPLTRPSIDQALQLLDQAMAGIQGFNHIHMNKLQLLQALKQNTDLIHQLNKDLEDYRHQTKRLLTDLRQKEEEIATLKLSRNQFGSSHESIDGLHGALDKGVEQQAVLDARGLRDRMEHYKQERDKLKFTVAQLQKELQAHCAKEQGNQTISGLRKTSRQHCYPEQENRDKSVDSSAHQLEECTKQTHRYHDEHDRATALNKPHKEQIKGQQHIAQRIHVSESGSFGTHGMKKSPSQPCKLSVSPSQEHRYKKRSAGELPLGGKFKPRATSANNSSGSLNVREMVHVLMKDGARRNVLIENSQYKLNPADLPAVIVKRKDGKYEMGALAFLGVLDGADVAGVVLDLPSGHTNGSWKDGKYYFHCAQRHGLYCKASDIYVEVSTTV